MTSGPAGPVPPITSAFTFQLRNRVKAFKSEFEYPMFNFLLLRPINFLVKGLMFDVRQPKSFITYSVI